MKIKQFSTETVAMCRREFGLEPAKIQIILYELTRRGYLDTDKLCNDLDKLKSTKCETVSSAKYMREKFDTLKCTDVSSFI